MKEIPNPMGRSDCFFCGQDNAIGLKLTFYETEDEPKELVCRWVPPSVYAGFGTILHGGIQSGLFDEIMGWTTIHLLGRVAVTTMLQVNFLKPVRVGRELEVRCRIDSVNSDEVNLKAEIRDASQTVCAEATGTYMMVEVEKFKKLSR